MLSLIPTIPPTKTRPTSNATQWLSTPFTMPLIQRCLSKSKILRELVKCGRDWKKHEGTPTVKSAKLYILKDKLTSFKMKDDESIPEMFHRLQVIVNDLKALGEKIKNDDVSHRFLMCLPPRFEMLRLLIIRGGLKEITPNQVLGDVMTQETYHVEREGVDKDEKKKDENKKKSVAFKASSPSKNKGVIEPPNLYKIKYGCPR